MTEFVNTEQDERDGEVLLKACVLNAKEFEDFQRRGGVVKSRIMTQIEQEREAKKTDQGFAR